MLVRPALKSGTASPHCYKKWYGVFRTCRTFYATPAEDYIATSFRPTEYGKKTVKQPMGDPESARRKALAIQLNCPFLF